MHAAAVALVYDVIAKEAHPSGAKGKHDHDEIRASSIAVVKVYEGKIAQTDLVMCVLPFARSVSTPSSDSLLTLDRNSDTKEFHADASGPELSCTVM